MAHENESESLLSLFCHEQPEQITHGFSFVKSDGSKSLKSLFKKEQMSEEQGEQVALGHKMGEKFQEHTKNTHFSEQMTRFLLK